MTVTFQISSDLERFLRNRVTDLDASAKEAFLVSLFRQGTLSLAALGEALALDRFETETVLKKHHVIEDLGTAQDVLAEVHAVEQLRANHR